jgi:peptidoglycan/xylan/chitin deacetylase (PgdA/CDA1 family)
MKIGSHTLTHPHLTQIDPTQMRHEIAGSKAALEDRLGVAVEHFCFPYGDHDRACVDAVAAAGYVTAVTVERGRVRRGRSLLTLPRLGNSGRRSTRLFQARLLLWGF